MSVLGNNLHPHFLASGSATSSDSSYTDILTANPSKAWVLRVNAGNDMLFHQSSNHHNNLLPIGGPNTLINKVNHNSKFENAESREPGAEGCPPDSCSMPDAVPHNVIIMNQTTLAFADTIIGAHNMTANVGETNNCGREALVCTQFARNKNTCRDTNPMRLCNCNKAAESVLNSDLRITVIGFCGETCVALGGLSGDSHGLGHEKVFKGLHAMVDDGLMTDALGRDTADLDGHFASVLEPENSGNMQVDRKVGRTNLTLHKNPCSSPLPLV